MLLIPLLATFQFGPQGPPPPFDDHAEMMKKLGLKAIRPGPDPNLPSNHDESVANPYRDSLPDVLILNDGTKVTNPAQWPKRRKEIAEDFEREVYGRVPKNAPNVTWEVTGVTPGMSGGRPHRHEDPRSATSTTEAIRRLRSTSRRAYTVPAHATAPVPIMVEYGFGAGFGGFGPRSGAKPWTQQAIERGWGYGTIVPSSIQPDNAHLEHGRDRPVQQGPAPQAGRLGRPARLGLGPELASHRLLRAQDPEGSKVDPAKVGIEGVSRYGKAALVAEAFDPRVAVGFVGSSGEGGAKLHRHVFGEAVENLAGGEFYWMAGATSSSTAPPTRPRPPPICPSTRTS